MLFDAKLNLIQPIEFRNLTESKFDGVYALTANLSYEMIRRTLDSNLKICVLNVSDLDTCNYAEINQLMDLVYINAGDHRCYVNCPIVDLTIPYKILVSEFQFNKPNHVYFPFWLFASRIVAENDLYIKNQQHKISCLNRNPRPERVYTYNMLNQLECSNDVYYSLTPQDQYGEIESVCTIKMAGYTDTMLNVITETYYDIGFLSEKTYKPIRAEQLFLIAGPAYSIDQLRKDGFDTFDDYIDHNSYDTEPNWQLRITKMTKVLQEVYVNIDTIYEKTLERRKANREYLLSTKLAEHLTQPVK